MIWRCHRTLRILSMWVYSRVKYSGQCAESDPESSMDQLFLFMDSDQRLRSQKEYYTLRWVYTHKN